jgi:hypothetical protein
VPTEKKIGVSPFGLAHVCREIRAEFRPLFVARTTLVIRGDEINAFIDSILFLEDIDISTLVARIRVEPSPVGAGEFTLDLKPLLQLSQVAEDISIVFKQTIHNTKVGLSDRGDDVQDRTLQELLEEMLGIQDFAMFIAFAERAIPQIKLHAWKIYAWIHDADGFVDEVYAHDLALQVNISAQYWSPLFGYTDEYQWRLKTESKTMLEKKFEDGGMGLFPRLDAFWHGVSFIKSGAASMIRQSYWSENLVRWQWQQRMEGLTWSRDMKGGKTPGKMIRLRAHVE